MPQRPSRKQSKPSVKDDCYPIRMNHQTSQEQPEDVWSRPNWPPRLEKIFVELLVEEMKYHLDVCATGFNEQAWDHVCKEFNQDTGVNFDKMELKKHLAVLRKRYRIVKPLYNHGGFGWDYRRKMVDVDDLIWKEYIEVHPEIAPYRKWGCPIYEELCTIFTKPKATGEHAFSVCGYRSSSNDVSRSRGNVNISNGRNKRQSAQLLDSDLNKKCHKVSENSKVDATSGANSVFKSNGTGMCHVDDDPYSASHCIRMIAGMQGVDRRLYNAALELFQHPSWRKTFVSLKSEKRLTWLKAMLPSVP